MWGDNKSEFYNILSIITRFQQKIIKYARKPKSLTNTQGKKKMQATKTVCERVQILKKPAKTSW